MAVRLAWCLVLMGTWLACCLCVNVCWHRADGEQVVVEGVVTWHFACALDGVEPVWVSICVLNSVISGYSLSLGLVLHLTRRPV